MTADNKIQTKEITCRGGVTFKVPFDPSQYYSASVPCTVLGCEGRAFVQVTHTGSEKEKLDASVQVAQCTAAPYVVGRWGRLSQKRAIDAISFKINNPYFKNIDRK